MVESVAPWKSRKFLFASGCLVFLALAYLGEVALVASPDAEVRRDLINALMVLGGIFLTGQTFVDHRKATTSLKLGPPTPPSSPSGGEQ